MQVIITEDSSHTILNTELNETYHSSHGAVQESRHVFIDAGFRQIVKGKDPFNVLEIGFGTGLNALLTLIEAEAVKKSVVYSAIEAYPLDQGTWTKLNYPGMLCPGEQTVFFEKIHLAGWGKEEKISSFFSLHKILMKLQDYSPFENHLDLIYFDAFSPAVQPELWTNEIFRKLFIAMKRGGVLTTYSVKGDVIRSMKAAGFIVEKIPGPPGKRQISRATK
ncbi:MAG: tRNA (5-methylaminomethyl-2-thiouridine)(34)-methyltransferase MnmD [Bacteroidetes bacterium]|nr:tRNA (5-methylaminomethyl-2-thiouridine)(34)-methyltransferase MnmD [Bacteroidota bacterium]